MAKGDALECMTPKRFATQRRQEMDGTFLPTLPLIGTEAEWGSLRTAIEGLLLPRLTAIGTPLFLRAPLPSASDFTFLAIKDGFLVTQPHRLTSPELSFVLSGQRYVWVKGRWFFIGAKQGMLIPEGVPFYPYGQSGVSPFPCEHLSVIVRPKGVIAYRAGLTRQAHVRSVFFVVQDTSLPNLFWQWRFESEKGWQRADALVLFFRRLCQSVPIGWAEITEMPSFPHFPLPLRRALALMHWAYDKPLRLSWLAQHCYVTPFHLCRLFKRWLRVTPVTYLTRLRLRIARTLLTETDLGVADVAFFVGYPNTLYFQRLFSRFWGVWPSQVRHRPTCRFKNLHTAPMRLGG
jgi:AraC-like DNA-binding protein